MANWKRHERETAKAFGVKRRSRGADFGESLGDTEPHCAFSIEAKYRKKLPQFFVKALLQAEEYDPEKIPIVALKERGMRGCLIICWMEDFVRATEDYCTRLAQRENNLQGGLQNLSGP